MLKIWMLLMSMLICRKDDNNINLYINNNVYSVEEHYWDSTLTDEIYTINVDGKNYTLTYKNKDTKDEYITIYSK